MILTEKQQKIHHYQQVELIKMNTREELLTFIQSETIKQAKFTCLGKP